MPSPVSASTHLHPLHTPGPWLYALWKFSRPHTIIGTSFSVLGLFAIAVAIALPAAVPWGALAWAWLACLGGNLYIVGLNQIQDIAIDRINKPHLPLAAGEFTQPEAWRLVTVAIIVALGLAWCGGGYLFATVGISVAIGTAYSLPPLRLKRFALWASACILVVRGMVVNLGLFLYFVTACGYAASIPAIVWALTGFVVIFSVAIAIFKDIPDIEGDRQYNIRTFTVRLGQRTVFNLARGILTLAYGGMMLAAPWLTAVNRLGLVVGHGLVLAGFWWLSQHVAPPQTKPAPLQLSYRSFYQIIWALFFLEYLMVPATCWLP